MDKLPFYYRSQILILPVYPLLCPILAPDPPPPPRQILVYTKHRARITTSIAENLCYYPIDR